MKKKRVIIIGAGPGGLSAGMLLANKGLQVDIFEKKSIVGGRNGFINEKGFTFDIGPTFLMMKDILEDIFTLTGRKIEDYLEITQLDPMYKLAFKDKTLHPSTNLEKMRDDLEKHFPGSFEGYRQYIKQEQKKYDKLIPCLKVPYSSLTDYLSKNFIASLPYLDAHVSLYDVLGRYFNEPDLKISFTFQAKYIGMSPWQAPGTFSIISFIEHAGGIYHVTGGLNKLADAMAKIIAEDGGNIHLSSAVKRVIIENKKAVGVELEDGSKEFADYVVVNADFADAMTKLVPKENRKKYNDNKISKMLYSCSTFMLYLGLDKFYNHLEHHNVFFADNYRKNVEEITETKILPEDPSFYVQNASKTDNTLAPEGKSTIYVLVPIANTTGSIDWNKEKDSFRNKIIQRLETKAGMTDLSSHIEFEKIITPIDWRDEMNVYNGATFNLGHSVGQMLYFRPHNQFQEFGNCYLVGGGTHPGSGLPTIYESGRISAEMILKKERIL